MPGALTFSIKARRDTLPAVLEILRHVLREPLLAPNQFEIIKQQRLTELERLKTQPGMLARILLQRTLTPHLEDDIRYVPTVEEGVARLQAATHEDVVRLHREYLGSQQGELTILGDFDPDACLSVLKNALAGWKAAKPYARIVSPLTTQVAGSEHTIVTPDKPNANYRAGFLFPLRDDAPDYPAVLIGNYIFGGTALSSRLAMRVRQQEGLS